MYYTSEFIELVNNGARDGFYIGTGNPNAKILIVGKEAAIASTNEANCDTYLSNAECWRKHIDIGSCEILSYSIEDPALKRGGHTWRKYQKLYDYVFKRTPNIGKIDFLENIFCTEMNDAPCRRTKDAQQRTDFNQRLQWRKDEFFKDSKFINQFPVIILACSNYIWNYGVGETRQIDNIFGVEFNECYRTNSTKKPQSFYTHFSKDGGKLVIHTNQLSGSTASNELLEQMGKVIRDFMIERSLIVV